MRLYVEMNWMKCSTHNYYIVCDIIMTEFNDVTIKLSLSLSLLINNINKHHVGSGNYCISIGNELNKIIDAWFIYTSGQRYGIAITKWHLCEFDRYLLFLVVCSIAERNTVDFIDPSRNQIEWPNTLSIVWGPLRLKRRKRVSSGVVTWSEVCPVIATLMLVCSVQFR